MLELLCEGKIRYLYKSPLSFSVVKMVSIRRCGVLLVLSVLLFAVFSVSVSALKIRASLDKDTVVVPRDGTAEFTLTVSHDSPVAQVFELYSSDILWDLRTDPSGDRLLTVPAGKDVSTKVLLKSSFVTSGYYVVPVVVQQSIVQQSGVLVSATLLPQVGVLSGNTAQGEYSPSVSVKTSFPASIDPRKEAVLTVILENLNRKNLSDVEVKIRSSLFNQDLQISLAPLERKAVEFKSTLDPFTTPRDDVVRVSAFVIDPVTPHQFEAIPAVVSVQPYGKIVFEPTKEGAFLESVTRVKVVNSGNVQLVGTYTVPGGFFKSLVSSGTPDFEKRFVNGSRVFSWDVSLGVGETSEIVLVTNYRLPFFLLLAIIAGFVAYFLLRSPIILVKSAVVVGSHEGGMSEFKVLLEVKNRSTRVLKNVNVIDSCPHLVEIVREFEVGSLRPVSILHHANRGTLLKWVIDEIEGREERVITYAIKSKLSILGSLDLPVAIAKFDTIAGRRRSTSSNVMRIGLSSNKGHMFK